MQVGVLAHPGCTSQLGLCAFGWSMPAPSLLWTPHPVWYQALPRLCQGIWSGSSGWMSSGWLVTSSCDDNPSFRTDPQHICSDAWYQLQQVANLWDLIWQDPWPCQTSWQEQVGVRPDPQTWNLAIVTFFILVNVLIVDALTSSHLFMGDIPSHFS